MKIKPGTRRRRFNDNFSSAGAFEFFDFSESFPNEALVGNQPHPRGVNYRTNVVTRRR